MQRLHRITNRPELADEIGAGAREVRAAQSAADAGCFAPLSLDAPASQGQPAGQRTGG